MGTRSRYRYTEMETGLPTSAWRTGTKESRGSDTVLHEHLRKIEVGADLESDCKCVATVGRAVRLHVEHLLDTVDLLLNRGGNGVGDDLGAAVLAGDLERGRALPFVLRRGLQPLRVQAPQGG